MPYHKDSDGVVVFMSEDEKLWLRTKDQDRYKKRPERTAVGLVAAYHAAMTNKTKEQK